MAGFLVIEKVLHAIIFFMPAYVANAVPTLFGGGRAIDFGRNFFDGRRIFGDGKTWRGSIAGISAGVIYKILENFIAERNFGFELGTAIALSTGAILGDIFASFIKRRLGYERGESAPLLDQLDFVIGAFFVVSFFTEINIEVVIIVFLITPFLHIFINVLGYILKKKEVPW